ncbi:MAG: prepilin-type N-terminal cleavage/methylation domain-containing protein [Acetobacterales bacterium]
MSAQNSRSAEAGITLIEVVVALAVAGLVAVVALRTTAGALAGGDRAEHATMAVLTAESLLAEAGVTAPLAPGTRDGTARGGYRWTVETARYDGIDGETAERVPVRPYTVAVTVRWGDGAAETVTLRTLKLQPKGRDDDGR